MFYTFINLCIGQRQSQLKFGVGDFFWGGRLVESDRILTAFGFDNSKAFILEGMNQ